MKHVLYFGSAALAGLVITGLILGFARAAGIDIDSTKAKIAATAHRQELVAFRKAWMNDCLEHAPPFQCIYMWSGVKPEEFVQ